DADRGEERGEERSANVGAVGSDQRRAVHRQRRNRPRRSRITKECNGTFEAKSTKASRRRPGDPCSARGRRGKLPAMRCSPRRLDVTILTSRAAPGGPGRRG